MADAPVIPFAITGLCLVSVASVPFVLPGQFRSRYDEYEELIGTPRKPVMVYSHWLPKFLLVLLSTLVSGVLAYAASIANTRDSGDFTAREYLVVAPAVSVCPCGPSPCRDTNKPSCNAASSHSAGRLHGCKDSKSAFISSSPARSGFDGNCRCGCHCALCRPVESLLGSLGQRAPA